MNWLLAITVLFVLLIAACGIWMTHAGSFPRRVLRTFGNQLTDREREVLDASNVPEGVFDWQAAVQPAP